MPLFHDLASNGKRTTYQRVMNMFLEFVMTFFRLIVALFSLLVFYEKYHFNAL